MTVLDVAPQVYYDAADICAKVSGDLFTAFKTGMASFGDTTNMAGSIGDGKIWAESYDQQAKDVYTMSIDLVIAIDGYTQVLRQAGYNHALADYDAASGQPEPAAPSTVPSFTLSAQELVSLLVPPSAGGPGRGLIDDGLDLATKVGIPIPDGDTVKLSHSGDVWNSLATNASVTSAAGELERAAAMFEQITSPDANFIDEDLRELKGACDDLAGAYGEMAQACRDQKQAHDDLRTELKNLLDQLAKEIATEVAVSLALSVAASVVSFGVGAAAVAAKTAVAVAKIIDKFVDLIRIAVKAAKLKTAVTVTRLNAARKAAVQRIKDLTTKLVEKLKTLVKRKKSPQELESLGQQIGEEVAQIPRGSGQLDTIISRVNELHLSQDEAAAVTNKASEIGLTGSGGIATLPNGTKMVLPTYTSVRKAFLINADGTVVKYEGDLEQFLQYIR
ncbi:hypothetical protein [Nocardia huaxiensis]|uniref:Uncharacterized protein n=1 Tax=Nocardia huaxiensis TaxID=2755382 RepID=A0A7D6V852_9NOCA|nr:hypothetical protein [Nocardia huaxiensis]QLY30032.1 hypothetical protein H0264_33375 [Nocardia huaxiensis]UFS96372.1 hypothetical protein LPY97_00015 [Nocardia huaxiensis]